MRLVVATTAHLPGDVRVRHKIVDSMIERDAEIVWLGPACHEQGLPWTSLPAEVRCLMMPPVLGRRGRFATPARLRAGVARLARERKPVDWVYCPDPDALLSVKPLRRKGARLWFDIHERYHNDHAASWLGPFDSPSARFALRRMITAGAQRADLVTSPSPAVLEDYAVGHRNAHLLLNSVSADWGAGLPRAGREASDPLVLMHGKPGADRGTRELAQALAILNDRGRDIQALVLGTEPQVLSAVGRGIGRLSMDGSRRAHFSPMPSVPYAEMAAVTAGCHVGTLGYTGSLAPASLPNRLFEYMSVGVPVVGPIESPWVVQVINEHRAGSTFSNADPRTLADAIDHLYLNPSVAREMGDRGREAIGRRLSWDAQFERIWALLVQESSSSL